MHCTFARCKPEVSLLIALTFEHSLTQSFISLSNIICIIIASLTCTSSNHWCTNLFNLWFIDSHIERVNRELQEVCTIGDGKRENHYGSHVQPKPTKQRFCYILSIPLKLYFLWTPLVNQSSFQAFPYIYIYLCWLHWNVFAQSLCSWSCFFLNYILLQSCVHILSRGLKRVLAFTDSQQSPLDLKQLMKLFCHPLMNKITLFNPCSLGTNLGTPWL